jgi:hypothetical protein
MVGKYRLTKETLGIVVATHLATSVPKGSIIEIPAAPAADDRTVLALWQGKSMLMFIRDLKDRAAKLNAV